MAQSLTWMFPDTWRPEPDLAVVRRERAARLLHVDNVDKVQAGGPPAGDALGNLDESALIEASLAGRAGAFDAIVARHRRPVYQLCYRFVGNHEDASDLSQDVFLRAYRGLHRFRRSASLATWLYRIAVNVCLNRVGLKTLQTEPIEKQQHVDTRVESASERLLRHERAMRVRAAIGRLPRKQRATLILRMYHEMPHHEIATLLGSSVGAVKANFFHALGNLKKLLGDEMA